MAITDNTAKWDVLSVITPQTNSGNGLLPVGHVYITMGSTAPTGSLPLTGLLYSRETYADLWNYVNTHPEQLLSESAWQTKYLENNGQVSYYSDGDGSTNFRVPTAVTIDTDEKDYIIENYKNGYSWYRKYKSGWIEQGGYFTSGDYLAANTKYTIDFIVSMKDTSYIVNNTINAIDSAPGVTSGTLFTISSSRKTSSMQLSTEGIYSSMVLGVFWEVKGFAAETPSSNRVSWCVKAFGNIEEATGSTDVTNVVNNITTLNTKVDNFVAGTLNTHATAIAKMQSYFSGNFEKTLLYGSDKVWSNANNITLSDSWKNYDGLMFNFSHDNSGYRYFNGAPILWKWDLEEHIRMANLNPSGEGRLIRFVCGELLIEWRVDGNMITETSLITSDENCGMFSIYGIKLKATGITNKSAVDVSDMSEKIGGLLTADNHLILPSGLEVW